MPQIEVDFNIYQPISKLDRFRLSTIRLIDYLDNSLQECLVIIINQEPYILSTNNLTKQHTKISRIENDSNKNIPSELDKIRLDYIISDDSLSDSIFQEQIKLLINRNKEDKPDYFI